MCSTSILKKAQAREMKEYINIDELSECLGIKKSTLYGKVERREIPYYKIGHLVRFKKTEIDKWVESLKQMVVDTDKKANEIIKCFGNRELDIGLFVKKTIASVKGEGYNPSKRETPQGQASERRGNGII